MQLAHAASAQALAAAATWPGTHVMNYYAVPNVIFTSPEVAAVAWEGERESGIVHRVASLLPQAARRPWALPRASSRSSQTSTGGSYGCVVAPCRIS